MRKALRVHSVVDVAAIKKPERRGKSGEKEAIDMQKGCFAVRSLRQLPPPTLSESLEALKRDQKAFSCSKASQ
jgi:hypothetical protein